MNNYFIPQVPSYQYSIPQYSNVCNNYIINQPSSINLNPQTAINNQFQPNFTLSGGISMYHQQTENTFIQQGNYLSSQNCYTYQQNQQAVLNQPAVLNHNPKFVAYPQSEQAYLPQNCQNPVGNFFVDKISVSYEQSKVLVKQDQERYLYVSPYENADILPQVSPNLYNNNQQFFYSSQSNKLTEENNFEQHSYVTAQKIQKKPNFAEKNAQHLQKSTQYVQKNVMQKKEGNFVCEKCGKSFKSKVQSTGHKCSQKGDKPFLCHACGKTFRYETNLIRHSYKHTGVKPFQCQSCGKSFLQKNQLIEHNNEHLGEESFDCKICGKSFDREANLTRHAVTHTYNIHYKCEMCEHKFEDKCELEKHVCEGINIQQLLNFCNENQKLE